MIDPTRLCPIEDLSFEALELDEINYSNLIAFTWAPDPNKYAVIKPKDQWRALLTHVLFRSHKYFSKFFFTPELTQDGNVHVHGWYIVRDKIAYFRNFLPRCRQFGFVKLKQRPQYQINQTWARYCEKDRLMMIDLLHLKYGYCHISYDNYEDMEKVIMKVKKTMKCRRLKPKYEIRDVTKYFNN